jgi:hypothetical protein
VIKTCPQVVGPVQKLSISCETMQKKSKKISTGSFQKNEVWIKILGNRKLDPVQRFLELGNNILRVVDNIGVTLYNKLDCL